MRGGGPTGSGGWCVLRPAGQQTGQETHFAGRAVAEWLGEDLGDQFLGAAARSDRSTQAGSGSSFG